MSSSTKIMYARKQEILDANDDYEEEKNDEDEDVDIQEQKLSFPESLAMLGKKNKCSFLDDESHNMLSTVIRKSFKSPASK